MKIIPWLMFVGVFAGCVASAALPGAEEPSCTRDADCVTGLCQDGVCAAISASSGQGTSSSQSASSSTSSGASNATSVAVSSGSSGQASSMASSSDMENSSGSSSSGQGSSAGNASSAATESSSLHIASSTGSESSSMAQASSGMDASSTGGESSSGPSSTQVSSSMAQSSSASPNSSAALSSSGAMSSSAMQSSSQGGTVVMGGQALIACYDAGGGPGCSGQLCDNTVEVYVYNVACPSTQWIGAETTATMCSGFKIEYENGCDASTYCGAEQPLVQGAPQKLWATPRKRFRVVAVDAANATTVYQPKYNMSANWAMHPDPMNEGGFRVTNRCSFRTNAQGQIYLELDAL